jgi:hypothetical protein
VLWTDVFDQQLAQCWQQVAGRPLVLGDGLRVTALRASLPPVQPALEVSGEGDPAGFDALALDPDRRCVW